MSYVHRQLVTLEKILLRIFDKGSTYFDFTVYAPNSKVPNLYDEEKESFRVKLENEVKLNDVYHKYLGAIMTRLPDTNIAIKTTVRNNGYYYTRVIYVQPNTVYTFISYLMKKLDKTNSITIPERPIDYTYSVANALYMLH